MADVDKETSDLTAVTTVGFADIFAMVQGGNSRRADFSMVQDLLDEQTSRTLIKPAGNQGRLTLNSASVLLTPDGADVTAAALIPARSIVLAVTSYVVSTLTGTMISFDVGVTGDLDQFGAAIGITSGSDNIGVVGPFPTYSDLDVIVTLNGGTGSTNTNKLRLVAYYLGFDTPAA